MSHRIMKQPDGRYAVWSTIVDGFLYVDGTREEVIEWYLENGSERREQLLERLEAIDAGRDPYASSGITTYDDVVRRKEELGDDADFELPCEPTADKETDQDD